MARRAQLEDAMLVQAMRQRILDEIKHRQGSQSVINNYGSGHAGGGGIQAELGGEGGRSSDAPRDDEDYFVDILRENLDPDDPKKGWKKSVHRFKKKRVTE